jgi:hypothetical protein
MSPSDVDTLYGVGPRTLKWLATVAAGKAMSYIAASARAPV